MEELDRAGVYVEIELEAQAEEDVRGVLVGGHAGIAERAKEYGVEFVAEHLHRALRESDFLAEILIRAPVELHKFQRAVAFAGGGAYHLDGFGGDLLADAVAGNNRDAGLGTAISEWDVGHVRASIG